MSCYWVSFLVESLPCGHPSSLKHKIGRRNYGSYHWCCQRIWQEKIKIRSRKFMGLLAGCVPCKKVHMRQKQGLNYPALQEVGQTGSQQQQFPEGCRTLLTHSVSLLQQSCHRSCTGIFSNMRLLSALQKKGQVIIQVFLQYNPAFHHLHSNF